MLANFDGRFTPSLYFSGFKPDFTLLCEFGAVRLISVLASSEDILLGVGAVAVLGGRQSGETLLSALREPMFECRYAYRDIQISGCAERL